MSKRMIVSATAMPKAPKTPNPRQPISPKGNKPTDTARKKGT